MASNKALSISEVNALPCEEFKRVFGNVVEHCTEAANHVVNTRPLSSVEALKEAFGNYLENLDNADKEKVLISHPDLAGKLAKSSLTSESQYEQKSAGIESMSAEERLALNTYNTEYKKKFGFPFVICARENKVKTILSSIQERLKNSKTIELEKGIQEVKKICNIRISDLVEPEA